MPIKIKTQCHHVGCPALIEFGQYCSAHSRMSVRSEHIKSSKAFYDSARWRKLRRWWLSSNPVCAMCKGQGSQVDHIKPIAIGGHPMDMTNLQTLCDRCHAIKTRSENKIIR